MHHSTNLTLTLGLVLAGAGSASGCGENAEPTAPHFSLPVQEGQRRVRDAVPGTGASSIAPYLLDVQETSVMLAWTTRKESKGTVGLRGEDGAHEARESKPKRHHAVTVDGLQPGTTYLYLVDGLYEGSVRTSESDRSVRFTVFGHPGGTTPAGGYPFGALAGRLDEIDADFSLCTGDLCYYTTESSYDELFLRPFAPLLKRKPIYVSAGNHDGGYPSAYSYDYGVFRGLFPYDYPSQRGAYYSFVRGHVHFLSLSYHPVDQVDAEEQLAWIRDELAASRSEFRIAFMGAANPPPGDYLTRLYAVLTEGGADMVFGGDGSGSFHRKVGELDYFFAGTNNEKPHDFFYVEVHPYELFVKKHEASMSGGARTWKFKSKRPKLAILDLLPLTNTASQRKNVVEFENINMSSELFHGMRVTVRNPFKKAAPVWIRWGPNFQSKWAGASGQFREQAVVIGPNSTVTHDVFLPALNPITREPWALEVAEVRIAHSAAPEGYDIRPDVLEAALIVDPLRLDASEPTESESGR